MSKTRIVLYSASATMLLLLFALPATCWIVRIQTGLTGFHQITGTGKGATYSEQLAVAAHHPEDFNDQFAAALLKGETHKNDPPPATSKPGTHVGARWAEELITLLPRFRDNPALLATILRYSTTGGVNVRRSDDENLLFPTFRFKQSGTNDAHIVATFDTVAEQGERLDSGNAYFPMMHAISLFSQHHDAAAIQAVLRASKMPRWEEYISTEMTARHELIFKTYGETGGIARLTIDASILFPQYAQLRSVARMMIVKAFQAERSGNVEEGFALRRAVSRLGMLMRVQSKSIIGALVGEAITGVAAVRPGGAESQYQEDRIQRAKANNAAYATYLIKIGHPEEAKWFTAERSAVEKNRRIVEKAMRITPMGGETVFHLLPFWGAGFGLLVNIASLLLLAIPAALLARTRRIQEGQPLPTWLSFGFWSGIAALLPFVLMEVGVPIQLLAGIIIVLLGTLPIWVRGDKGGMVRGVVVAFLTFSFVSIGGSMFLQLLSSPNAIFGMLAQLRGLMGEENSTNGMGMMQSVLLVLFVLGIPILTLIALTIFSLVVKVPVSVGIVRGLRGLALPISCALLLVYGGVVFATVQQENRFRVELIKEEQNENQYLAQIGGLPLPGATPEPSR